MGNGCTSIKAVFTQEKEEKSTGTKKMEGHEIKIIFVGDNLSGKSSLIASYANQPLPEYYKPTKDVSITSVVKKLNIPQHELVKLQLWEIPGHEKVDVRRSYYADAHAAVVVMDTTDDDVTSAFNNAAWWRNDIEGNYCKSETFNDVTIDDATGSEILNKKRKLMKSSTRKLPVLLVGNKFDLKKSKLRTSSPVPSSDGDGGKRKVHEEVVTEMEVDEKSKENGEVPQSKVIKGEENDGNLDTNVEKNKQNSTGGKVSSDKQVEEEKREINDEVSKNGVTDEGKDMSEEAPSLKLPGETLKLCDDVTMEEFVEDFEQFSADNDFISGILTCAISTRGGAIEAIQSLVRRAMTTEVAASWNGEQFGGTELSVTSSNTWEIFQLQEVGIDDVDDVIRQGIPLVEEGEKLKRNLKHSVQKFREICSQSLERSNGIDGGKPRLRNIEECIGWIKEEIVTSYHHDDVINKKTKKRQRQEKDGRNLTMTSPNENQFINMQITTNNGDIVTHLDPSYDVTRALTTYQSDVWPACNDVIMRGEILEKSLTRLSAQLTRDEENLWENTSGFGEQKLGYVTSALSRDKTRIRGLLADVKEMRSDVTMLKARIRAAILF